MSLLSCSFKWFLNLSGLNCVRLFPQVILSTLQDETIISAPTRKRQVVSWNEHAELAKGYWTRGVQLMIVTTSHRIRIVCSCPNHQTTATAEWSLVNDLSVYSANPVLIVSFEALIYHRTSALCWLMQVASDMWRYCKMTFLLLSDNPANLWLLFPWKHGLPRKLTIS